MSIEADSKKKEYNGFIITSHFGVIINTVRTNYHNKYIFSVIFE